MKDLLTILLASASIITNAQTDIPYPKPLADTAAITFLPGIVSKDSIDFGSAFSPDGKIQVAEARPGISARHGRTAG